MKTLTTTLLILCSLFCKGQIRFDTQKSDTVKCILLVTDVENKSSMVYAIYGYYVTKHNLENLIYLDDRKRVLNKVIVWMAKEIK